MPAEYLYVCIYILTPNLAYFSRKKYFGVSGKGWTSVLVLAFSEAPAVLFCGGMEGEYAMGEGFGEPLDVCWFVFTLGPSFWRPKPDRRVRMKNEAMSYL